MSPILTFAVFSVLARNSDGRTTLDTATVFTSLSLFTLLSEPLGSLIMALAAFMGGVGSFRRIQGFLTAETRTEKRKLPFLRSSIGSASDLDYESDKGSDSSQKSRFSLEIRDLGSTGSLAVIIERGHFGWDKEKQTGVLQSINMSVPRAKITMVVGPVGCGKSTLLKAVLGELPVMGGTVQVSSLRIALCDQTPWHVNGTVQQSIVGVSDFDQRWYAAVVRSCALDEDLRQLPQGDQTQIGSKGIALSGGQSQRIVRRPHINPAPPLLLATNTPRRRSPERYTLRKISSFSTMPLVGSIPRRKTGYGTVSSAATVFYDVAGRLFSSLRHLVSKPTLSLIPRCFPLTPVRVIAKRLPYCDHIVTLDKDGQIVEQGSFDKLNRASGYVSNFDLPPPDWDFAPEKHLYEAPPKYTERANTSKVTEDDIQAETNRRTGDAAIYLYYVQSVGWIATLIFVVSITIFIFGQSFPSK